MNILTINFYAGSSKHGMEYRPYYLSKEWVKMGHKVGIVASSFAHTRKINPEVKETLTHEQIEGINYYWLKTLEYKKINLKRFVSFVIFLYRLNKNAEYFANEFKPEVVIASSTYPMDIYFAHKIAKLSKAKLVYEVHDLLPLTLTTVHDYSKFHPFIVWMQHAENYCYKYCHKVISILPKTLEHMKEHGLDEKKWAFVPNGVDIGEWDDPIPIPKEHKEKFEKLRNKGKFIVGYAGYHGVQNSLIILLKTAEQLKGKNIEFVLVGQGPEKDNLIQKTKELKLENVHFLPTIEKKSIPNFHKEADILFMTVPDSPLYKYGVGSNKLFDYMMSAKPVVQVQTAGNDIVADANCGISVPVNDYIGAAEAILKLRDMTTEQRNTLGQNGRKYI